MRSKTLLVSNIFATLYTGWLMWVFIGTLAMATESAQFNALVNSFEVLFDLIGARMSAEDILILFMVLLAVHSIIFILGSLIGWIAYAARRSGGAKFAAFLYLLGTICFPVYLYYSLTITILGFVGGSKQKEINKRPIVKDATA